MNYLFQYFDYNQSPERAILILRQTGGAVTDFITLAFAFQAFYGSLIHFERCANLVFDVPLNQISVQSLQSADSYGIELMTNKKLLGKNSRENEDPLVLAEDQEFIKINNVQLRYSEKLNYVLKNINLEIGRQDKVQILKYNIIKYLKVSIVGRTGAGKSTLVQCLTGLLNYEGFISVDSQDFNTQKHKLNKLISVVPQEPFVFEGTLLDNIDPNRERPEHQIQGVLNQLNLNSGIFSSLNQKVEIGGRNLSRGQTQMLLIVRMLVQNNQIIILDECAQSLDSEYEDLILKVFKENLKEKCVISITHKINMIQPGEKIIEISDGEIISQKVA